MRRHSHSVVLRKHNEKGQALRHIGLIPELTFMRGDFEIGRVLVRQKAVSDKPPLRRNRERPRVRAGNNFKVRYKRGRGGKRSAECSRRRRRKGRARSAASGWAAAAAAR